MLLNCSCSLTSGANRGGSLRDIEDLKEDLAALEEERDGAAEAARGAVAKARQFADHAASLRARALKAMQQGQEVEARGLLQVCSVLLCSLVSENAQRPCRRTIRGLPAAAAGVLIAALHSAVYS